MSRKEQLVRPIALATVLCIAASANAASDATVVSPRSMGDWTFHATNTAAAEFVKEGPATPPLGKGSLKLTTGDGDGKDKGGKVWVGTAACDGVLLSNVTSLSYSLYVESAKNPLVAPYLNIHLDTNDNGKWDGRAGGDDILAFDPAGQPPPGSNLPMATGTWNTGVAGAATHDAGPNTGGWWIVGKEAIAGRDGKQKTLTQIIEAIGDHKIIGNSNERVPGLTFIAGAASGGTFTSFTGHIDRVVIGVKNSETTYDFEWSEPPSPVAAAAPAPTLLEEPDSAETGGKFGRMIVIGVVGVIIIAAVALAKRKR